MTETDDKIIYWLPTPALAYATNSEAAEHQYWLAFREAADELYRAYSDAVELPDGIELTWTTPRFLQVLSLYPTVCKGRTSRGPDAFRVIAKYRLMKILRQYVDEPIVLFTEGNGISEEPYDDHRVLINGIIWHYWGLDGNHRLMAAFYVGIAQVPVLLKHRKADTSSAASADVPKT